MFEAAAPSPLHVVWLGAIWLALSVLSASHWLFAAFQLAITLALMLTVYLRVAECGWYMTVKPGWLHPVSLQGRRESHSRSWEACGPSCDGAGKGGKVKARRLATRRGGA